jgi:TPR repeat protein
MPSLPRRLGNSPPLSLTFASLLLIQANAVVGARAADVPRLEAGAEHGSVRKQMELGTDYFLGRGVQRNEEMAAYWYEKAANSGDPAAQQQIGYFYQLGIGVPRDLSRAAHWYQLAAAGGLAGGKMNLGVAYLWGLGVPQNKALAVQLFHEAADKGCGTAAGFLGDAYFLGVGVPKDVTAAEHWYSAGAKMRDPRSQFRLASMLSARSAEPQDLRKAASLLRESSDSGFVPAKLALGLLIANHPKLAEAPDEAVRLLEAAAAAGTWRSSAVLGALARDGRGMPADPKAAYLHFKIAQMQGGEEGREMTATDLSILAAKLSAEQVQALDIEAAAWTEKHRTPLEYVYNDAGPAFALTAPSQQVHAGRLMPNPD